MAVQNPTAPARDQKQMVFRLNQANKPRAGKNMNPKYLSPNPDNPGGLLWRTQAEAASLIGSDGLAKLRAAGLTVTMNAGYMRDSLGQGFHVTDPETGDTFADCPGLVAPRTTSPHSGSSIAQPICRDDGDCLPRGEE